MGLGRFPGQGLRGRYKNRQDLGGLGGTKPELHVVSIKAYAERLALGSTLTPNNTKVNLNYLYEARASRIMKVMLKASRAHYGL